MAPKNAARSCRDYHVKLDAQKGAPELFLGDELQVMRFAAIAARFIARQKTHQVFRCHLNVVSGLAMGIPCTSSLSCGRVLGLRWVFLGLHVGGER